MAGIDKSVMLLIHGDGTDNGTTITDSSYYSRTITRSGVVTKTGTKKFGTASLYFDGSDDYISLSTTGGPWYFAQENFCIDFWYNPTALPGTGIIYPFIGQYTNASVHAYARYVNTAGVRSIQYSVNGTAIVSYNIDLTVGQWYHIAITRNYSGGTRTTRLFLDGTIVNSSTNDYTISDMSSNVLSTTIYGSLCKGYFDEFRICKYESKYISDFTVLTEAYSESTVFHINPATGNNNLSGTSWDSAWKNIKYGAATYFPVGSTIKVAKSPDPVSIGNATWTHKSATVTLASSLTQEIDNCESGWTAATYITLTYDSTNKKQGTYGLKLVFGSSFTTGKVCHKTLSSPLDLSAFTALSFWFKGTVSIGSSYGLKICLCSDTSGNTIVDTFYVCPTDAAISSYWVPKRIAKGSALGSSIQSVAIYIEVDPGAPTIYFDNILACNDFSLFSLISKKDTNNQYEAWYGVQSIVGTTVLLDQDGPSNYIASNGYYGTSGSNVETFRLEPIYVGNSDDFHTAKSGSADNLVWYSGGWNTSSDEIDGHTYVDGLGINASGIVYVNFNYNKITKINPVRGYIGFNVVGSYNEIEFSHVCNCTTEGVYITGSYNSITGKYVNCIGKSYNCLNVSGNCNIIDIEKMLSGGIGLSSNGFGNKHIFDLIANMSSGSYSGILVRSATNKFYGGVLKDNATNGVIFYDSTGNNQFYDILLQSNVIDIQYNAAAYGIQHFINCTFESTTLLYDVGIYPAAECRLIKIAGDINNNTVYKSGGNIVSQATTRHTSSGIAWKISPTSTTKVAERLPLVCPLATIAVVANTQVTVSAWFQRTNTELTASLVCREKQLAGITSDVVSSMTADADTWQQLTIQFTPTEAGVVEIEAQCYGGTTYSMYIDDLTVS